MENSNNEKLIGAVLIGTAIGGILGILFAPDKGSETRKRIGGRTDDLTSCLKDKFSALMGEAKSEYEIAKENASEFSWNGKG